MGSVRFSRRAREDLLDIWAWIARDSPKTADKVLDRIRDRCAILVAHPEAGRARPEVGEGARSLVVQRWVVFYRLVDGGVQVVRVVDSARDLKSMEWSPA